MNWDLTLLHTSVDQKDDTTQNGVTAPLTAMTQHASSDSGEIGNFLMHKAPQV